MDACADEKMHHYTDGPDPSFLSPLGNYQFSPRFEIVWMPNIKWYSFSNVIEFHFSAVEAKVPVNESAEKRLSVSWPALMEDAFSTQWAKGDPLWASQRFYQFLGTLALFQTSNLQIYNAAFEGLIWILHLLTGQFVSLMQTYVEFSLL